MRHLWRNAGFCLLLAGAAAGLAGAFAQDPAEETGEAVASGGDPTWPRFVEDGGVTFTVYQPQIDKFDDTVLEARAAVKVETPVGDKTQTSYGVIWITAHTFIDKEQELVELDDIQVVRVNFPTAADKTDQYLEILRRNTEATRTISLNRIEANLAITQADKKGNAVPVKNDPPKIYYREKPALLVLIDGEPALRPMQGASGVQHVINTRSLILQAGGSFYLSLAGKWLQSPSATGPWQVTTDPPASVVAVLEAVEKDENQSQVDLVKEPGEELQAVFDEGKSPEIIVSTVPAELILVTGKPDLKPVTGTQLLYVTNTGGDILLDLKDQSYYVTLTGRWYRSKSLQNGPWSFVEGDELPPDFAKIPESDPKSSVLATVAGTPAAQEAAIANSIPQTAEVKRDEAKYEARYDGDPQWDDVPDTDLQYAPNTPNPVIRVDASSYYSVQSGIWFTAGSPLGPWAVATAVPPVIYSIPTASPIHYVTYVRIYRYNPTHVWVGYTPGYLGTCYAPWGTVVYGTGWHYRPWIGSTWYGAPWTWGFGVGISWSPWTGWDVGFGWGGYRPIYRPWWGPYYGWRPRPVPVYAGRPIPGRPYARPGTINITNVNVYNRAGVARPGVRPITRRSARPATGPSTRPGQPSTRPGQPATRPGQPSTRPSTRPVPGRDVYAGRDGNVYRPRPQGSGWETNDRGQWKPVQPSRPETRPAPRPDANPPSRPETRPAPRPSRPTVDPSTINQLSRDRQGRQAGDTRMSPPPPSRQAPPRPQSRPQSRPPSRPNPKP